MEKFNRIKFKRINYVKLVRTLLGPSVAPSFYSAAMRGGGGGQEEEEEEDGEEEVEVVLEACHMLEGIEAAKTAEHASNTAVV
jgi:hypothetical protein